MRPSLRELLTAIAYEANRTVGGGLVSIELLRRRFTASGWIDSAVHGVFIAVSRFTPGTVVLAYVVMLGWRFHRWRGALPALAAASIPGSLIVLALAATLAELNRYAAVRALLAVGILVAGVLVLGSAWHLIRPYVAKTEGPPKGGHYVDSRVRVLVVGAMAVALVVLGATPVRVLLMAAVVSMALPFPDPTGGTPEGVPSAQK
ncbi:MAG: chromate transporter [Vicinamibacterales bacterium]